MVRRHTVALMRLRVVGVLVAPAILLAGCSESPQIVSDQSDLDAAAAVWTDPWVAPTAATVAGPEIGSDDWVSREVARRTTPYTRPVDATAAAELVAATGAGWSPTSSSCLGDEVLVSLAGPGDTLASLVVTSTSTGSEVEVRAVTPHHVDEDWAVPDELDTTCLDGGASAYSPPPAESEPLRSTDLPETDAVAWSEDRLPDESAELLAEVNADPALGALGVRVPEPDLSSGVNRRRAPAAEATAEATGLRELADLLPEWQLTYAACGAGGPVRATFLRGFDAGPAVLSAVVEPDGTTLRVTLPVAAGPEPSWLEGVGELTDTACWRRTPRRIVVDGTPAVLPGVLTPIAD